MTQIVETINEFFAYSGRNVFIDGDIFGSQNKINGNTQANHFAGIFNNNESVFSSRIRSFIYLTGINESGEVIACKIKVEDSTLEVNQKGVDQQFENAKINLKLAADIALRLLKNRYDSVQSGFIDVPRLKDFLPAALPINVNWWTFQNNKLNDRTVSDSDSNFKFSPLLDELINNYKGA